MGLRIRGNAAFDPSNFRLDEGGFGSALSIAARQDDASGENAATRELRDLVQQLRDTPSSLTTDQIRERVKELKTEGADFSAGLFGGPEDEEMGVLVAAAVLDSPDLFYAMLEAIPEADRAEALNKTWGADNITAMHALALQDDSQRYKAGKRDGGRGDIENAMKYTPDEIMAEHRKRGAPMLAAIGMGGILSPVGLGVLMAVGVGMLAYWYFGSDSPGDPPTDSGDISWPNEGESSDAPPVQRLEGQTSPKGEKDIIAPDPDLTTAEAWRSGSQNNEENLDRVIERAQQLLDELNDELGTDYKLNHNFDLARNGVENVPLYLSVGSVVIGSIPQEGFIGSGGLDDILGNLNLNAIRGKSQRGGRSPRSLKDQGYYILTGLASLLNIARATDALGDRIGRILGGKKPQFMVENAALGPYQSQDNGRSYGHRYGNYGSWGQIEFNPFEGDLTSATRPFFSSLGHELGHADQYLRADGTATPTPYNLRPGEFDGQRRQIDGVPVVYRMAANGRSGRWKIELKGGALEIDYVEARQRGVGPFADTARFSDTDNALDEAFGFSDQSSYSGSQELGTVDGKEVWGNGDDPWNKPDWTPPPVQPSQPTRRKGQKGDKPKAELESRDVEDEDGHIRNGDRGADGAAGGTVGDHTAKGYEELESADDYLKKTDSGAGIRTLFSDEETFDGNFIRITQIKTDDSKEIVGQFVVDVKANPELAKLVRKDRDFQKKLGKELDFTDVINMRYRDGGLTPIMKQAADGWLSTYAGSKEEFAATSKDILSNKDKWSDEELQAVFDSGILDNKAGIKQVVHSLLYDRFLLEDNHRAESQDESFEDYVNGLLDAIAVYVMRSMPLEGPQDNYEGFSGSDRTFQEHLHKLVRTLLLISKVDNGLEETYHFGDDNILADLPSMIANRVRNAFKLDPVHDGGKKAGKWVKQMLEGKEQNGEVAGMYNVMKDIVAEEHGWFSDWVQVNFPDDID